MSEAGRSAPSDLLVGLLAAAVWSLPAAVRAADGLLAWGALFGSAALVMAPLVVSARALRGGTTAAPALLGLGLAAAPLAFFAALLDTRTHHRPLGGATFAVVAAVVVVGCWVAMHRVARGSRLGYAVAGGVAVLSFVLALYWLSPVLDAPDVRASAIDVVLGAALVLAATRLTLPLGRVAARLAPWGWAIVVVAGLAAMAIRGGSDLVAAAPAIAAPGGWIVGGA